MRRPSDNARGTLDNHARSKVMGGFAGWVGFRTKAWPPGEGGIRRATSQGKEERCDGVYTIIASSILIIMFFGMTTSDEQPEVV
jgi:hypothetical protein